MRPRTRALLAGIVAALLAACILAPTPSATVPPTATTTPHPTDAATNPATPVATGTQPAEATPSPEPTLGLDEPPERDERVVAVEVSADVRGDGGEIIVSVTSQATDRIDELVIRWPRELNRSLFLRPFVPSEERIRDGGPPLVQTWTKWVLGPGEDGEPEGTVSLGYGPLLAGATLNIPINVVRREDGPVAFDLQVLAENSLLSLPGGQPAELRIEIP